MDFIPVTANLNYGNHLKHEKEVKRVKEVINNSLELIHNVHIVIHPTAELSIASLNPDLIPQGKQSSTDLGSTFEGDSWLPAELIQLCNLLLNQALRVSRGNVWGNLMKKNQPHGVSVRVIMHEGDG